MREVYIFKKYKKNKKGYRVTEIFENFFNLRLRILRVDFYVFFGNLFIYYIIIIIIYMYYLSLTHKKCNVSKLPKGYWEVTESWNTLINRGTPSLLSLNKVSGKISVTSSVTAKLS